MAKKENERFGLGELPEDAVIELHPALKTASFTEVLSKLNELIEIGLIKDYAIGGGFASIYHHIPYLTKDVDVLVVLSGDEDFQKLYKPDELFSYFEQQGYMISKDYVYIAGMAVQFFPNISPLFNEAVREAERVEINGIPSKIVSIEYLIALLLVSFRFKDKIKISELLGKVNMSKLYGIVGRFDNEEKKLSKRLEGILGES